MPLVYVALCVPNGKMYFGITTKALAKRIKGHKNNAGRSRSRFSQALTKYGADNFVWYEIGHVELWRDACEIERLLIRYFGTRDHGKGYNGTDGGEGTVNPTPEVRERIGAAQRGRTHTAECRAKISAYQKGRPKSEVTRQKMSAAQKGQLRPWQRGKALPDETRQKIAATRMGQPMPESVRQALRNAHEGRPLPAAWRENISKAHTGKTMPEAVRKKIAASKKGHPVSEETRQKISAARKRRSNTDADV